MVKGKEPLFLTILAAGLFVAGPYTPRVPCAVVGSLSCMDWRAVG